MRQTPHFQALPHLNFRERVRLKVPRDSIAFFGLAWGLIFSAMWTAPAFAKTAAPDLPLPPAYEPPPTRQIRSAAPTSRPTAPTSIPTAPIPSVPPPTSKGPAVSVPPAVVSPPAPLNAAPSTRSPSKEDGAALDKLFQSLGIANGAVRNTEPTRQCEMIVPAARPTNMKSESELLSYISCYSDNPTWTESYLDNYSKYIHTAAMQFGVPETLLTCLLFRESQFNSQAESKVYRVVEKKRGQKTVLKRRQVKGAVGVAQFMPETEKFVSSLLSTLKMPKDKVAFLGDVATSVDMPFTAKDKVYANTALANYEAALRWQGYFDQLKSQNLYRGEAPSKFDDAGARDPKIAVGASAFYLRYIMDLFNDQLSSKNPMPIGNSSHPDIDFMLTIAGSYNMGHGAAINTLRRVEPATTKNWYDHLLRSNPETEGHMRSIRNCSETGNFKPNNGTPQRDCTSGDKK